MITEGHASLHKKSVTELNNAITRFLLCQGLEEWVIQMMIANLIITEELGQFVQSIAILRSLTSQLIYATPNMQ